MSTVYKKRKVENVKRDIPISYVLFKQLTCYLLSEYRSRSFIIKLDNFYKIVNTKPYEEDMEVSLFYHFSRLYASLVADDNIYELELIIDNITSNPTFGEEFKEMINNLFDEVSSINSDIAIYIENQFSSRLNMISLFPRIDEMINVTSRFKTGEYDNFEDIVDEIQRSSANVLKSINAKSSIKLDIPDMVLNSSDKYMNDLSAIVANMNSGSRMINMGIKRLNDFFGGGIEPGRVYVGMAVTGGFKSGWMLNASCWACKYNDRIKIVDQLKKPCALYINIENKNSETMERLISYVDGVDEEGKSLPPEQIYQLLENEKLLNGNWLLGFLYRKKGTINTGDLDGIINNFENEHNCEVKVLILDYLKRIGPARPTGDIRLDLGEVVNDLSILASSRDIAVITANQLNRAAYEVLQSEKEVRGKVVQQNDMARKLTNAHGSESSLIIENADCVFAINKEESRITGVEYLTFKMLKNRSDKGKKRNGFKAPTYFAHPFEEFNSMRLQEDFDLSESLSVNSIEQTTIEALDNGEIENVGDSKNFAKRNLDEESLINQFLED